MNKLYVAYGSNLNVRQMGIRCPNAKVVGIGELVGYQLTFRGVATVEPRENSSTPVAVWEINPNDEKALDRYEGYPRLYRKENISVRMMDGSENEAMVYIMNEGSPRLPNNYYLQTIEQGYDDIGLDKKVLQVALEDTRLRMKRAK